MTCGDSNLPRWLNGTEVEPQYPPKPMIRFRGFLPCSPPLQSLPQGREVEPALLTSSERVLQVLADVSGDVDGISPCLAPLVSSQAPLIPAHNLEVHPELRTA